MSSKSETGTSSQRRKRITAENRKTINQDEHQERAVTNCQISQGSEDSALSSMQLDPRIASSDWYWLSDEFDSSNSATQSSSAITPSFSSITNEEDKDIRGDHMNIFLSFKKASYQIRIKEGDDVEHLKDIVRRLTGIGVRRQKLIFNGRILDTGPIRSYKLSNNSQLMLIGSREDDIRQANVDAKIRAKYAVQQLLDNLKNESSPLCRQEQHVKILERGIPPNAMQGVIGIDESSPTVLEGLVNNHGFCIKLTFDLENGMIHIVSKDRTDSYSMDRIRRFRSEPIEGCEEYSILGIGFGQRPQDELFIYWIPSQYINSIRRVIGG